MNVFCNHPGRSVPASLRSPILRTLWISVILVLSTFSTQAQSSFAWPGGTMAAVCLTYDDGLDCHLDVAAPALEAHGLRGTFYVTGKSPSLDRRLEEWRQLAGRGHELGNHTLFHPCHREGNDWVLPEFDLNHYSMERLRTELQLANTLLKAVDGKEQRSLAYTCAHTTIEGISFVDSIRDLFPSARGGGPLPETMDEVDLHDVPSWMVTDPTGEELIAYVKQALEKGTVAVVMFHSVGGGYLNVSAGAHNRLLEYLDQHREEIWTAPFMEVMQYVQASREAEGPNP